MLPHLRNVRRAALYLHFSYPHTVGCQQGVGTVRRILALALPAAGSHRIRGPSLLAAVVANLQHDGLKMTKVRGWEAISMYV